MKGQTAQLDSKRLQKRNAYFQQQPVIEAVYRFKQQLYGLLMLKTQKAKHCQHYLPIFLNLVQQLKESPFKSLATLGKTFMSWQEEIVRMWRFSKNNGIMEGFQALPRIRGHFNRT